MTAGGLPTVQVLLDDGTGTFPYDITAWARMPEGISGTRGRQDELSTVSAPQPMLTLDNQDGRFSYGSTIIASPSPILIDQQVRVKLTANGTTVTRYTGTLIADQLSWPGGGDEFAIVTVTLADVQAQAERRTLRSVPEEEILLDGPDAYYLLSESAGAVSAADSSGGQQAALALTGAGTPLVFGSGTGPTTDGLSAATFANGQYLSAILSFASVPTSIAIGFYFTTAGASIPVLRCAPVGYAGVRPAVATTAGGFLGLTDGGSEIQNSSKQITDSALHHGLLVLTATTTNIYVDGVGIGAIAGIANPLDKTMLLELGGLAGFTPNQTYGTWITGGPGFSGTLSHVTVFTNPPSAARIAAEAAAGLTGFAGESGVARITRIAGYAGIPLGTLDTSLTNMAFEDITSKSAMQALQDVVDAEFGTCYFDGTGAFTFHNRNKAVGKTAPDITIDANQLDPGTQFFYDTAGILNRVEVTAQGTQVTQVAWNKVSELGATGSPKHGRYPDSKTYLVQTDAEALDRGNWLVNRHGQPAPRAGSLVVDLLTMTAAQQATWLAVEPDTWVRITGLPAQTHGGTTADLIVQGWAETLFASESDAAWSLALNTSSRPAFFQAWILDDPTFSVLDSTTRLYV